MKKILSFLQEKKGRAFTTRQLADALQMNVYTVRVYIGRIRANKESAKTFETVICQEHTAQGLQAVARHFIKE